MLDILPPLWMRGPVFAMREFMAGSVTSVFFALRIGEAKRWFHAYCDLSDGTSVGTMRTAIISRESRPVRVMTREERLEHIWSMTADDYRGYASELWPASMQSHRTITVYGSKEGAFVKFLDALTDDEISAKLPVHLRHLPSTQAAWSEFCPERINPR